MRFLLPALASLGLMSGCAYKVPVVQESGLLHMRQSVTLYRRPLEIRLSTPASPSKSGMLVVYATGDGGWRGLGDQIFRWISAWNYPVAGFSSKAYLKNLGYVSDTTTTTPRRLVRDFEVIIDSAESALGLPKDTPIVLVGISRGAGLAVVAAGQEELKVRLAGVVAIALTKEEEHVVHYRIRRGGRHSESPRRELVEIKTYDYLPRLAGIPITVIQSSNDGYLPAAAARNLFGPDTDLRKLLAVQARNHSFSGGCSLLYRDTEDSLAWIEGLMAKMRGRLPLGSATRTPATGNPE